MLSYHAHRWSRARLPKEAAGGQGGPWALRGARAMRALQDASGGLDTAVAAPPATPVHVVDIGHIQRHNWLLRHSLLHRIASHRSPFCPVSGVNI